MERLFELISKKNKYIIESENKKIKIIFNYSDRQFIIEAYNLDGSKKTYIGTWYENADILQLHYQYEFQEDGMGNLKQITYMRFSKIKFVNGPHQVNDSCAQDKWIFDREIFFDHPQKIFYSF